MSNHGTHNTYTGGCRCAVCREANRVYNAAARARRSQNPALAAKAGHGKESTYVNYRCRCAACRAAHTDRARTQRARRTGGAQ